MNRDTKPKNKPSIIILAAAYLLIWIISLIVFWFFSSGSDAMGYSILFLWMLLPLTTFVISLLIGKNPYWGNWKWLSTLAFGIMYMLAEYTTFSAANMAAFDKFNPPHFGIILVGAIISAAGMGIGSCIHYFRKHT